jgi:DNA-binding transcriptional ArsR family regulator
MGDKKAKGIAEILRNETSKKILDLLSERAEASEKDIASDLGMRINTVEYNLKKLLNTGLIEKSKRFFWSRKGRKIDMYKVAKKHIVISPKETKPSLSKLKSIIPVLLISLVFAFFVMYYFSGQQVFKAGFEAEPMATVTTLAEREATTSFLTAQNYWLWFFIGAVVAVVIFAIWNWKKL